MVQPLDAKIVAQQSLAASTRAARVDRRPRSMVKARRSPRVRCRSSRKRRHSKAARSSEIGMHLRAKLEQLAEWTASFGHLRIHGLLRHLTGSTDAGS
jgi:hypothetical protein